MAAFGIAPSSQPKEDKKEELKNMADRSGATAGCNDRCGCPNPCPGRDDCRCMSMSKPSGGDEAHKRCTCGEHCSCNPCSCAKAGAATGTGRLHCRCSNGCTCATCAA